MQGRVLKQGRAGAWQRAHMLQRPQAAAPLARPLLPRVLRRPSVCRFRGPWPRPLALIGAPMCPLPSQEFGIKGDMMGLLPGRQTYVIDANGKVVMSFNNQFEVRVCMCVCVRVHASVRAQVCVRTRV